MKKLVNIFIVLFHFSVNAQQENPVKPGSILEQQLENLTEQQEGEPEDDYYLQTLVQLKKHPLNLNNAGESELREMKLVSELQIQSLISYKKLLGNLLNMYELQAVPGWDIETIQKVLPYIKVEDVQPVSADLRERFKEGKHSVVLRMQQVLQKSNGYLRPDSLSNRYYGSRQQVFLRYKFIDRNLLQYGITAEKDAGEQFFKGNQKKGFDFYSFHLFIRKLRGIKLLALGDFTVNLGQGLIQWQSLAFKKSADITAVKRQADVLRPYNSAGEFNFFRGAGITINRRSFNITAFFSSKRTDGTSNIDTLQSGEAFVSTILNTGYHRTNTEVAKRKTLTQSSIGGNISYKKNSFQLGVNALANYYSKSIVRDLQPYNQFAITGSKWFNYSVDYSYTYQNIHFFGEAARDKNNSPALITGLLASLDPKVDISFVYRNIDKKYQAVYGNAFTESTTPTNEKGLYAGIGIKPVPYLKINAYADFFSFPWLKYRIDAPSMGSEYLLQLTYTPNKKLEIYTRFKNENKANNISEIDTATRQPEVRVKHNWRTQVNYNLNRFLSLRSRLEILAFEPYKKERSQQGLLSYIEATYKSSIKPVSINTRMQYFNTDDFDSRIYALERDVLYSYSIPQFIGSGFRYYINLNYDLSKKITLWFRWAQTIYNNRVTIGSGLDQIPGNKRSEVKMQWLYNF